MVRRVRAKTIACTIIFLLALALGATWLGGLTHAPAAVALPYTPQDANGWTLTEADGQRSLSRTMEEPPEYAGAFSVLRVTLNGQAGLTATLDGEQIFSSPAGERTGGLVTFSLPEHYGGKTLTLRWTQVSPVPLFPAVALTTPALEQTIYYAQASGKAIPAAVSLTLTLLTIGLFCLSGAMGRFQWALLLLALGPVSQFFYWWAQMPQNAAASLWEAQLLSWSHPVFCWLPALFLLFQVKRKTPGLIIWAVLAAADFGLSPLLTFGASWLMGIAATLPSVLARLPILLELIGGALVLLLAVRERRNNGFFKLYAPPALIAGAAVLLYALISGQNVLVWAGPGSPVQLLFWCIQVLALAVSLIRFIQISAQRDGELHTLSALAAMAQGQLSVMEESAQALREQGHDIRHHYAVLQGLLQEGEPQRAAAYLHTLTAQTEEIPAYAYTAHPAVNAILSTMLNQARRQGIQATAQVELPETLPISDADLTTLLMNLLENALEANKKAPEGAKMWLDVLIYVKGLYLFVEVDNARFTPVDYDRDTGVYQTDKPGNGHGFGIKAAQAVARKYSSELLIVVKDGEFSASTALLMKS